RRRRRHRRTGDALRCTDDRHAQRTRRRRRIADGTGTRLVHAADRRHRLSGLDGAGRARQSAADRRAASGVAPSRASAVSRRGTSRVTRRGRVADRSRVSLTPTAFAQLAVDARAEAGESPWWSAGERCLYWVDIHGRRLHRFDVESGSDRASAMPDLVTFVATHAQGGLVVALRDRVCHVDVATETFRVLARPPLPLGGRLNDGTIDPHGRLLIGTMDDASRRQGAHTDPAAALYRIDIDGSCVCLLDGFHTVNGLAFAPDGRTL